VFISNFINNLVESGQITDVLLTYWDQLRLFLMKKEFGKIVSDLLEGLQNLRLGRTADFAVSSEGTAQLEPFRTVFNGHLHTCSSGKLESAGDLEIK
jgi:hypothetical protein